MGGSVYEVGVLRNCGAAAVAGFLAVAASAAPKGVG